MNLLAIDTSSQYACVVLSADGVIYRDIRAIPRQHNQWILPMVQSVLQQANLSVQTLDGLAYGVGPGSFVGVRLAAAVAQGLAMGGGIQIIPFSSMQAIAMDAYQITKALSISVCLDARVNSVYWGNYHWDGQQMQIDQEQHLALEALAEQTPQAYVIGQESLTLPFECHTHDFCPDPTGLMAHLVRNFHHQAVAPEAALPVYLQGQQPWQRQSSTKE